MSAKEQVAAMKTLLEDAINIVAGSRHEAYGNPADNHARTAAMWSAFLGIEITGRQVCFMNILQKCSREAHWSQRDNALDAAGYAANAEACSLPEEACSLPEDDEEGPVILGFAQGTQEPA